jgi:hypothetical protein
MNHTLLAKIVGKIAWLHLFRKTPFREWSSSAKASEDERRVSSVKGKYRDNSVSLKRV